MQGKKLFLSKWLLKVDFQGHTPLQNHVIPPPPLMVWWPPPPPQHHIMQQSCFRCYELVWLNHHYKLAFAAWLSISPWLKVCSYYATVALRCRTAPYCRNCNVTALWCCMKVKLILTWNAVLLQWLAAESNWCIGTAAQLWCSMNGPLDLNWWSVVQTNELSNALQKCLFIS